MKREKAVAAFTSGFMSIAGDTRIALFLTGHNHAGENMADILAKRSAALGPPYTDV